jgi:hypothetical protein
MRGDYGRRRGFLSPAALMFVFLLSACSKPDPNGDVNGSVFVVTAGAGAYKLALVKVYFCGESDVKGDLKTIADDYAHQDNDTFTAATKAESDNEAAKKVVEAANAKLADANAQNQKIQNVEADLAKLQSDVDRMKTGIANLIEKERPDIAKDWDGAYRISGEIMDQLYFESEDKRISLEGLVAVFGCVMESSKNSGKSLRDQMNISVLLVQAFKILTPTSNLGQIGQDTFALFSGQSDSVIGHALVGPDAGSGSSVQSEYETAVRASDQAGIYDAIFTGASHQIEEYKKTHVPEKPPENNYSLAILSSVYKNVAESAAKLVVATEADSKTAGDAQAKADAKFHDLKTQFESLPEKEAARCMALSTKFKFETETDADGQLKLRLPKQGRYVVFATTQRTVGTQVETYYWVVPFSLNGGVTATLTLTNDNEAFGKDGGGAAVIDLRRKHADHDWKE